jgi:hypothetical protein
MLGICPRQCQTPLLMKIIDPDDPEPAASAAAC